MKALHFDALARTPGVALALMGQAQQALFPFYHYLRHAIEAARERQVRYVLPWERVTNQQVIHLQALDSLIFIPKPDPPWRVDNWPENRKPDYGRPLMVSSAERDDQIEIDAAPSPDGKPRFHPRKPLRPDDSVRWCGVECRLVQDPYPPRPREISCGGRPLKVLDVTEDQNPPGWLFVVEGTVAKGPFWIDGRPDDSAEILPPFARLEWLRDEKSGNRFKASGPILRPEELPDSDILIGDNKVRYRWHQKGKTGRRGAWIQLLPPEGDSDEDEALDPRAAFIEDEVKEIWTQPRYSEEAKIKVLRVDGDNYQLLLERFPPPGSQIYLPVDVRSLRLQQRALRQLREAPLPDHRGLLRLCEDPAQVRWNEDPAQVRWNEDPAQVRWRLLSPQQDVSTWFWLTDPSIDGTEEQREFVRRALATRDFTFLEGPPGSGKTTAICELIDQLVRSGKRVLLCATTNVALDNVLERMLGSDSPLDAVRIGRPDKVDERVLATQLDSRIETLVNRWKQEPLFGPLEDEELRAMAERIVVLSANLTCGTTTGIINHPLFRDPDRNVHEWERPITRRPPWDVLIVDEASKTTIQEFMVPALMARRWIVVGDIRQLPPYVDRSDVVANLRPPARKDKRGVEGEVLSPSLQQALLILFRLSDPRRNQPGTRWLIVAPPGVLDALGREMAHRQLPIDAVRIIPPSARTSEDAKTVTLDEIRRGSPASLYLYGAQWVLVEEDLLKEVSAHLPGHLLTLRDLTQGRGAVGENSPFLFRQKAWIAGRPLRPPFYERGERIGSCEELMRREIDWFNRHDWGGEVAWRLIRIHELRQNQDQHERTRCRREVSNLLPTDPSLRGGLEEIVGNVECVGLPSILEVIQEGIGEVRARRRSALSMGFKAEGRGTELDSLQQKELYRAFQERFVMLSYQHRMHPTIAEFPREVIYRGSALRDANTIPRRDSALNWDFLPELPSRRVWRDVRGRIFRGVNEEEIARMREILSDFLKWAQGKGPPNRPLPDYWEVACLCFYRKQEQAISQMLQELTGDTRKTRFPIRVNGRSLVEIVCGVVDRFQGREADLVLLSMRNTARVGFLDSINRLNVALTRARQQLIILGNRDYFGRCGVPELEQLVNRTAPWGRTARGVDAR